MVAQILGLGIKGVLYYSTLDDTHSKPVLLPHQDHRLSHTCGDSNMKRAYVTLV